MASPRALTSEPSKRVFTKIERYDIILLVLKNGTNSIIGGVNMIVMNLELDNILAFEDFKVNFSYPKKIVNSSIPNEFLKNKTNFRYKKINILLGANASGKTSVGRALMFIFNFINKRDSVHIKRCIKDHSKVASFSVDFLIDEEKLYRVNCKVSPNEDRESMGDKKISRDDLFLEVFTANIRKRDSYESCAKNLQPVALGEEGFGNDYIEQLKEIPAFGWLFTFPESGAETQLKSGDMLKLGILEGVLKTLDPSILKVEKSKEVEGSYIIRNRNGDIIIQNGEVVDKNILSSGTRMGIDIAFVIDSICANRNGFYYCDEQFSFIETNIEQAILSLMISMLHDNTQLFFTTHNLDLLEMDLPIHSFLFLRKDEQIEVVYPEKYIKKNDISLKNAVLNDIFNISPDISNIFDLEESCLEDKEE